MTLPAPAGTRAVRWRYHFTDFRLGRLLATLPMTGVSLSDVLGGPADGTGTVPLSSAAVRARDPFRATVPRRSCCWAERQVIDPRGGQVLRSDVPWAGLVLKRERQAAGRGMKLSMVTWPAYLAKRLVATHLWTQADKFTIARTLAAEAAAQPPVDTADPGVYGNSPHTRPWETTGGLLSGVLADRTYLDSDLKPALEALTQLGNSGQGFDWRMVPFMAVAGDLTSFQVRLELGYPRLGRVAPPDLRWSTDRADSRQRWGYVADLTLTEDGSAVANRVTALGAGTGPDQIRAIADSTQLARNEMRAGYPLYEASVGSASSDDRTYDTVYGKALGALLAGFASETQVTGIKVRGDLAPDLVSYALGDDLTVKIGDTMTGQPQTVVGQLVGRTVEPAEAGRTETVTLDVQGQAVA